MGHEFVGRVQGAGRDVRSVRPGDRVVVEPNYSCGRCPLCREGNRNLCFQRTTIGIDVDGAFAELARVPERCCWAVPAKVADDDALLAEPLAAVTRAVKRGAPRAGETAAVVGAGTLGLLALQVLTAAGARVLVVSRTSRRFAMAKALGAADTHAVSAGSLDGAAQQFSGREGVDLVIEPTGSRSGRSRACRRSDRPPAGATAVVSGVSGTGLVSPSTIIRPSGARPNLGEVWAYRELLYFLVWRDLKVRYKQTVLGIAWAVLQPLATTLVFAIFLGRLAGMPSDGVPYPVFAYAAMLPWQLFAHALTESINRLEANVRLITN